MYGFRKILYLFAGLMVFMSSQVYAATNITVSNLQTNFSAEHLNNFTMHFDDNGLHMDVDIERTIVNGFHLYITVHMKVLNTKNYRHLFTYDLDICPTLAAAKRSILKTFFDTVRHYGNFKPKCPINKGNYYVKNWQLNAKSIPGNFLAGDYLVTFYGYYGKYRTKSEIFLFSGSGEISLV